MKSFPIRKRVETALSWESDTTLSPNFWPSSTPPKGQRVLNFASSKKACTMYTLTARSSLIWIFQCRLRSPLLNRNNREMPASPKGMRRNTGPFPSPAKNMQEERLDWLPIRDMHNSVLLPPPAPSIKEWTISDLCHSRICTLDLWKSFCFGWSIF